METNDNYEETSENYFNKPSLILRVKSMMIDSLVIIILMYLASILLNYLEIESGNVRGIVMVLVLLYEPIFVTINRTVGQKIMGLRVIKFSEFVSSGNRININIANSFVRFMGKITLGWISLLTIHSNEYGQAIHDKLGNSIMTIKK